jgi:Sigma-54 interaction domain
MIPQNILITLFIVLNALILFISVFALRVRLDRSLRRWFFLSLLSAAVWVNLILALQLPDLALETIKYLIRSVFATVTVLMMVFNIFIFRFAGASGELRSVRNRIFTGNNLLLLGLVCTDYVVSGAKIESYGASPQYGILHAYVIASLIVFGIYTFLILGTAYKSSNNELLRYQLKSIFWGGVFSFTMISITNGIVPLFFKTSMFSPIGSVAMIFVLGGILFIAVNGSTYLLRSRFAEAIATKTIGNGNWVAISQYLETLRFILKENVPQFHRHMVFARDQVGGGDSLFKVTISGSSGVESLPARLPQNPDFALPEITRGLADTALRLDYDNKQLSLALLRAESELQEKWLSDVTDQIAKREVLPAKTDIRIAEHLVEINNHMEANEQTYGIRFCAFSPVMFKLMRQAEDCIKSDRSILISGEAGTGRKTLAHAIHYRRTGQKRLPQIACANQDINSLQQNIRSVLKTRPSALLVADIDAIPVEFLYVLNEVFEAGPAPMALYFTMHADYETALPDAPQKTFEYLNQVKLSTPPLRKRREDIVPLLTLSAAAAAKANGRDFRSISALSTKEALEHSWPGNIPELQNTLHRAMLRNKEPHIASLHLDSALSLHSEESTLTPLEKAERRVISEYLRKNNYNKNRTRIELNITVNTLNAKIIKYGIKGLKPLLE